MKTIKIIIAAASATIIGISSVSHIFAESFTESFTERTVLKNVSGDVNLSNSYHYSTAPVDENAEVVFKIDSKNVKTNNTSIEIDEAPFIKDGTTLLPLKAVSDSLNVLKNSSQVNWNSAEKKATVCYTDENGEKKEIVFIPESKNYTINGEVCLMQGSVPVIKNSRIFIPLRVLAEAMGLKIDWNENSKEITIKL